LMDALTQQRCRFRLSMMCDGGGAIIDIARFPCIFSRWFRANRLWCG
jgi:hypothetical protein